ncbi:MAG: ABC transporter permease, partial [Candidatus Hydrogenedentes bacterium]|nr:ABC transporter permease [Candidatus Hydrogenedentota bacterium]
MRATRWFRGVAGFREFMLLVVIVFACIGMSFASDVFASKANILATLLNISTESIVAIGMTLLMVAGGFDLSVGANVALCGAATALGLVHGWPPALAIPFGLGLGACVGLVNGLIIAYIGINPFITTLGMMSILRGLLLVTTHGTNITGLPESFKYIGQGKVLGVQWPIVLSVALLVAGDILLRKWRFFRQSYYIGGNERAALLSGIPVKRITLFNYALAGLLAALAGIVMTARLGAASVTAGTGLELKVISAV